jgi:hypothetical protein
VHAPLRVALRHFLMHDAAARRHPLHVARAEQPAIAQAVAVFNGAAQDISDGLDAAMGMPGKAGEIIARPVVAEIVEQQERIGLLGVAETEGAAQFHAGAFDGGRRLRDALDGTDGHEAWTFRYAVPGSAPSCPRLPRASTSGFDHAKRGWPGPARP